MNTATHTNHADTAAAVRAIDAISDLSREGMDGLDARLFIAENRPDDYHALSQLFSRHPRLKSLEQLKAHLLRTTGKQECRACRTSNRRIQ